jgi:hypothetical protein
MKFRQTTLRSALMARLLTPKALRDTPRQLRSIIRVSHSPAFDAIEALDDNTRAELAWQRRATLPLVPEET